MRLFILFLTVILLFTGCAKEQQQTDYDQSSMRVIEPVQEEQDDMLCVANSSQFYASGIEIGANSLKGKFYLIETRGSGSIMNCDSTFSESWSNTMDYTSLAQVIVNTYISCSKICGSNVFVVASSGFSNTHDLAALKKEISKLNKEVRVEAISPQQEGKLEWMNLTGANPDAVLIGVGGGSTQIASDRSGVQLPIGSSIVVDKGYKIRDINNIISSNIIPLYMKSKDVVYLTGGMPYLMMWHGILAEMKASGASHDASTLGKDSRPQAEIKTYSLNTLKKGLSEFDNKDTYIFNTKVLGVSTFGISRQGLYLSGLALIKYLEQLGIEDIRISRNDTWMTTYVMSKATQKGFSSAGL